MYLQRLYNSSGYGNKPRPYYSKTSPFANALSLSLLLSLSLFCNGHCMCSQVSNPYNVASRARCIIGVHGYLTPIISTDLLATFTCCSPLSLFCNGHCMCSRLSNPYNVVSRARCIIGVHGYLTPIISTALLATFTCCSPLSLFCNGH